MTPSSAAFVALAPADSEGGAGSGPSRARSIAVAGVTLAELRTAAPDTRQPGETVH